MACPVCGSSEQGPIPEGPCWPCLRGLTRKPERIGDYEILELIGTGGTGRVHLAQHRVSGGLFALKLPKTELAPELFVRQARLESALRHPHVVRAQLGPEHEGRPTLVMSYMSGGKLTNHAARRGPLTARLELGLKLARALQFAHGLGVVHSDLKPDNVLLDAQGEPHLCDFGLARAVADDGDGVVLGGSPGWMSPEQARSLEDRAYALEHPLTTATDVFSFGVLLHWLVTGDLPFGRGAESYGRVLTDPAPALPRFAPDLGWGMLAIARKALEKEPSSRYLSVAALANDLGRLREHERLVGVSVPAVGRTLHWAKRHPGARNAVLALLPCFAVAAFGVVRQQRTNIEQAVLSMNAYAATGQAAAVLFQLHAYTDALAQKARAKEIQELVFPPRPLERDAAGNELADQNPCRDQTTLGDNAPLLPLRPPFATVVAMDSSGCARARAADEVSTLRYVQRRYDWRDYFTEARPDLHPESATAGVRHAYRSSVSGLIKFAVSTPIFRQTGSASPPEWIGVLIGSLTVTSTLELPRTAYSENVLRDGTADQVTVVLGSFEGDTPEEARRQDITFLAHPKLGHGAKVTAPPELAREMKRILARAPNAQFELPTVAPETIADYVDPLLGDRWLAAYAPVGGTGYLVLVQTRLSTATRPIRPLERLAWGLAVASGALILAWGALFGWSVRADRTAELRNPGPK